METWQSLNVQSMENMSIIQYWSLQEDKQLKTPTLLLHLSPQTESKIEFSIPEGRRDFYLLKILKILINSLFYTIDFPNMI